MQTVLIAIQLVLAVALIVLVMMQSKAGGLGAIFGGGGSVQTTRRGSDLFLHNATIVVSALFFAVALAAVLL